MLVLALSIAPALAGAPLEVKIDDPTVTAVLLDCGGATPFKAVVNNGVASFPQVPQAACTVSLVKTGGTIDNPGKWTCNLDSCAQDEVHHTDVVNADGRINVVLPGMPKGASLEVSCPDGWRSRVELVENTAVFESVPDDKCTLSVKGAIPARFSPITWGTWFCQLAGTTAVCHKKV